MMKLFAILSGLTALLFTLTANAQGVSIDPGMWEMTSTMTMTMMPQPQTTTVKECVEESELGPETFDMGEDNPCNISDLLIDDNSAGWSISCPSEGGPTMEGQWEFTSDGDSISGSGSMTADYGGQKMSFNMTWEGKRIGDCE